MSYDPEEIFWQNQRTNEDIMKTAIWNAKNEEEFNKHTERDTNFIKDHLSVNKDDVVLDFGCGKGRLIKPLSKYCKNIVGLDVNQSAISESKVYLEGIENSSCYEIPGNGRFVLNKLFDKIYSYIVLQHINKYKVYNILLNLKKHLAPGGKGLFQFPNLLSNEEAYKIYANDYVNLIGIPYSHMHFWTKDEAKFIFKLAGWSNIEFIDWESDFWIKAE